MSTFLVILFVALAAIAISAVVKGVGPASLQKKFVNLGDLRGMTEAHIVGIVGEPNSRSAIGPDQQLLQWMQPGYHIALSFTSHVCDGVTHEHSG